MNERKQYYLDKLTIYGKIRITICAQTLNVQPLDKNNMTKSIFIQNVLPGVDRNKSYSNSVHTCTTCNN